MLKHIYLVAALQAVPPSDLILGELREIDSFFDLGDDGFRFVGRRLLPEVVLVELRLSVEDRPQRVAEAFARFGLRLELCTQ